MVSPEINVAVRCNELWVLHADVIRIGELCAHLLPRLLALVDGVIPQEDTALTGQVKGNKNKLHENAPFKCPTAETLVKLKHLHMSTNREGASLTNC